MAKIAYSDTSLHSSSRAMLNEMIKIIQEYETKGFFLTVRQLYYQLVSRNIVPNSISSYQRTSKILTTGRMIGEVDWDTIVDRARRPIMPNEFSGMSEFIDAVKNSYRRRRWEGQDHYVEVLVEKEALAGILESVTREYHVLLLANKGYSSASAIHDVAERLSYNMELGKECHILYLGDHDPSGMDMVRDIQKRLEQFRAFSDVERIALNMDQIKRYDPPPNPAKTSDPRSASYVQEYGHQSWELDALNPEVLTSILESSIKKYLDLSKYESEMDLEEEEKDTLEQIVNDMN